MFLHEKGFLFFKISLTFVRSILDLNFSINLGKNMKNQDGILKALNGILIPVSSGGSTVDVHSKSQDRGWDALDVKKKWIERTVEEWSKRDAVRYFFTSFRLRYGVLIPGTISYPICYGHLQQLMDALCVRLSLNECPMKIVKDYYDFFFQNCADDLVTRNTRKSPLTLADTVKPKYLVMFTRDYKLPTLVVAESIVKQNIEVSLSVADLDAAYDIHAQYFCSKYGIILTVNYLMLHKGLSREEAIGYVNKVIKRLSVKKNGLDELINATKKYQPYPKWFPFLNVEELIKDTTVEISGNQYQFLSKEK
jgi:hypothetical protein